MSRRTNDKQRQKRDRMYAMATWKAMDRARTPAFEGTETISWADVPKTFENFRDGYYEHSGASKPDDVPSSVGALPAAAKRWIASKSLLGDPQAETFSDLVFFPVVNPSTNRLNAGALRAVLGGRGSQARIPRAALDSARSVARRMLDDEYGEERSLEKNMDEPIEKDSDMMMVEAFGGATSWGELDEYLEAAELSQATRQATFEFEALAGNILADTMSSMAEKSEMIAALAADLPSRVAMLREKEIEIEADEPETGVLGAIKEIFKASKMVDGHRLMPGDFAHVGDREDPRTWEYPLVTQSGKPDARRIASAIENLKGTGPGSRPSVSRPMVMSRIRSAITRAEASDEVKEELRLRLAEVKAMEVNSFHIFKDRLERWRWFGWVTNKWRDRDESAAPEKGGEILTEEAHKDYVAWVDKDPGKRLPELWAWHTKETAHSHRADWLDYSDGFVLMSGPLTDDEAKAIERVAAEYDLGMSHGFYAISRDEKDALITKYRTFEASFLPRELAANPWTDFVTLHKEADMGMSDLKRTFLSKLAGEEFVEEIERETGAKSNALEQAGVDFKANEQAEKDETAEVEAVAEEAVDETLPEVVAATETVEPEVEAEGAEMGEYTEALGVIAKSIADSNAILAKMAEKLDGLETRLDAVERDDATKVAEQAAMTPRMSVADHVRSVIGNPDAKVDGRSVLAKSGPEETEAPVRGATGIPVLDRFKQLSATGSR